MTVRIPYVGADGLARPGPTRRSAPTPTTSFVIHFTWRGSIIRRAAAAGVLVGLLWACGVVNAQTTLNRPKSQAAIAALSMATPLGGDEPQGDVEEISCRAFLACARCHVLSLEFTQAAALDYSWIDSSACKVPEVREGTAGTIWIDGITVMSDTLDSVRSAVLYLRDSAPSEYRLPANFLSLHDLSFALSRVPLITRGTSAGLAFVLSAYSAATGTPLIPQVAVTGAINQEGKVGPVGNIVRKVIAADRLGFSTVIIPAANAPDLALLPPDLPKRVRIILADSAYQALFHALGQAGPRGAEYDAMYQNYLAAISLNQQGNPADALRILSGLAASFPEDYSLRVWIQYLQSASAGG